MMVIKIFEILCLAGFWHFWPFSAYFDHNLGSTNDRRLVLVSNIMFWDEVSEKNFKKFFWAKKKFFWPRGGHFGYPRPPSTMK